MRFRIDLINEGRQVDVGRAALEAVGHFRRGKLMQHALCFPPLNAVLNVTDE